MIYRVKEPFSFTDTRGVPRVLSAGTLITEGHEAFRKSWMHLFEPVEDAAARVASPQATETATAAPGEQRAVALPSELDVLRGEATELGVKVDKRWSAERLRKEIDEKLAGD